MDIPRLAAHFLNVPPTYALGRNTTMAHIRAEVVKAVADNDLNDVAFQDPFTEEARKAKRNLVAASFAAILIASLNLQVTGFLGLQAEAGVTLASSITKGIACVLVAYFLAGFTLTAYIDYSAWKFKRERALVRPYLELVKLLEAHIQVTGEQIKNATARLGSVDVESDMRSQVEFTRSINEAKGQLFSIHEHARLLQEELKPLLEHWKATVGKAERLSWRLGARFLSLWLLDIAAPLLLAVAAIWRTHEGLVSLWARVAA